jgi:hypothetical protein
MKTSNKMIVTAVVTLALFVLALTALSGEGAATAAPLAAPTPIASINTSQQASSEAAFMDAVVLEDDANSTEVLVKDFEYTDIQYVIDQTDVNTVTLKLQFSNDGTNWTDGATLVSSNAADAAALAQQALFGKFARINADVANTESVTVTVLAVLK